MSFELKEELRAGLKYEERITRLEHSDIRNQEHQKSTTEKLDNIIVTLDKQNEKYDIFIKSVISNTEVVKEIKFKSIISKAMSNSVFVRWAVGIGGLVFVAIIVDLITRYRGIGKVTGG